MGNCDTQEAHMGWEPTEAEKKQIEANEIAHKRSSDDAAMIAGIGLVLIIPGLLFPPLAMIGGVMFFVGLLWTGWADMRKY